MDIVVTSKNQSPSNFSSNFLDSISLADNFEIGVKGIFHGPAYNITEQCNTFRLHGDDSTEVYTIAPGFYVSTCDIVKAIHEKCVESGHPDSQFKMLNPNRMLMKCPKNIVITAGGKQDTLLETLGFCEYSEDTADRLSQLNIENYTLDNQLEVAFLYSSIVSNMQINQQSARLLACFPVRSVQGYNYYEVKNPMYRPLAVHAFTDLHFYFTDIDGNEMRFADLPTVIILNIRKI